MKRTLCSIVLASSLLFLPSSQANISSSQERVESIPYKMPKPACDDVEAGVNFYDNLHQPLQQNHKGGYNLAEMDAVGFWFLYDPQYAPDLIIAALLDTTKRLEQKNSAVVAKYIPVEEDRSQQYYLYAFSSERSDALAFVHNNQAALKLSFVYGSTGACQREYTFFFTGEQTSQDKK